MSPPVLIVTVTVVVGLVAVGVALLNVGPKAPIVGRATTFAKPFYYEVPGDSGIKLFPGPLGEKGSSEHLHVLATRNAPIEGMSIWIVGDGLHELVLGRYAARPSPSGTGRPDDLPPLDPAAGRRR